MSQQLPANERRPAEGAAPEKNLTVRQAAFIGVGAIAAAAVVLVTFIFTTLIHEPASIVTLLGVFLLSIALDLGWKRARAGRGKPVQVA